MTLAIFDLDNTLIGGDSDTLWGDFLCARGYVDKEEHTRRHAEYYQDYLDGKLDIMDFLNFQLDILGKHDMDTLISWRDDYLTEMIEPILLPKALALVDYHRQRGDQLLIITATNHFITKPIAQMFGIEELIAADPEIIDGQYTGRITGTPSFAEGKVTRLKEWLSDRDHSLEGSWFYSDSRNDIPLLEQVENPIAVDPDQKLKQVAEERGWKVMTLRD